MKRERFVTSLGFTTVMTMISLAMLIKSFIVARNAAFESGITDLVIWAIMAVTWLVALVFRLRSRMKSPAD